MREGLARDEVFVVVSDKWYTDTADYADIIALGRGNVLDDRVQSQLLEAIGVELDLARGRGEAVSEIVRIGNEVGKLAPVLLLERLVAHIGPVNGWSSGTTLLLRATLPA